MASERAGRAVLGLEQAVAAVVRGEAGKIQEAQAERALLDYIESLERTILDGLCYCGPTDPNPHEHRGDCIYRETLRGSDGDSG